MKAWRVVLLTLSFLMLGGCLVTFSEPLPGKAPAPKALVGSWATKDAWGEPLKLVITRADAGAYKAVATPKGKPAHTYVFNVVQQGNRWYLSARVPRELGGNYVIAGFDIVDGKDLVVYPLDVQQVQQAVGSKELTGHSTDVAQDNGEGVLVDSPPERVLAYLNDPANSDLFAEAVRFERAGK